MGNQLLIIVFGVMIIFGLMITILSSRQIDEVEVNQSNFFMSEAKLLSFTYAEIGVTDIKENYDIMKHIVPGKEKLILQEANIGNNPNYHASAEYSFIRESDDVYIVKSKGTITSLDKKATYTGENQVKLRINKEEYKFPEPTVGKHSFKLSDTAINYTGPTLKNSVFWREGDTQIYIHRSSGRTVAELMAGVPNYQWAILGVGIKPDGSSFMYMDKNVWSELGQLCQNNTAQGMSLPIYVVKYTMLLEVQTKSGAVEWREFTYVFERDTEFRTDNLAEILGVAKILNIAGNGNTGDNKKYNATFVSGNFDPMQRDEEVNQVVFWSEAPIKVTKFK